MTISAARSPLVALLLMVTGTTASRAQSACAPLAGQSARSWPAPLDRAITLHLRDAALRDALDRLAASAKLRFSYSAESLPLDRRVCTSFLRVPVGDALAVLLHGLLVEPIGAGGNHIVLAPAQQVAASAPEHTHAPAVIPLERIVVTGSTSGIARRPLTFALDVIDGEKLARQNVQTMADALAMAAPGMWLWQQSPSSLLAQYGSVRGASSFGLSYPKVYLDGIEVANPLLITRLAPETIDRIEAIRGPQGAALYGADAISGVVNLVTRHDVSSGTGHGVELLAQGGVTSSAYAVNPVMLQTHTLSVRAGSNNRSGGFTVTAGTADPFIPGAFTRQLALQSRARLVGATSNITATLRYSAQEAGAAASPLLADARPTLRSSDFDQARAARHFDHDSTGAEPRSYLRESDSNEPQSVQQYTVGLTAKFQPGALWTHALTVGLDGYRLQGANNAWAPIPSPVDSALLAARGGADRGTFRFSSVARFGSELGWSTLVTLAAEHTQLRRQTMAFANPLQDDMSLMRHDERNRTFTQWENNTGFTAQAHTSFRNALFLNGGLRLEHNESLFGTHDPAVLPLLGMALVRETPGLTFKLRSAYGKGIRPAASTTRDVAWPGAYQLRTARNELDPEEQAGVENGIDLLIGDRLTVHVTRFDQTATGLIQQVVADSLPALPGRRGGVVFQSQNVGAISNRGWELQANYQHGSLGFTGNLSLVESRVQHVDSAYRGDLRVGDRMLGVPALTASATASWSNERWYASLTAARAADWVGYDRLAVARDYASTDEPLQNLMGPDLRSYWRSYNGVTRLRATASRDLSRGIVLSITGENLLNYQRGEPDDITILPGRTISLGVRAKF
jgi:iron complex outermembrane receptor protein